VSGLAATEQGVVHVDIFTKGGLIVVDGADVVPIGLPSNFATSASEHFSRYGMAHGYPQGPCRVAVTFRSCRVDSGLLPTQG
jgi:hypothetical protein